MISDFLKPFFSRLKNENIDYAVVRNHAGLPNSIPGTDIDILVHPDQISKVDSLIQNLCTETRWDALRVTSKDFRIRNYLLVSNQDESPEFVVLDIMTTVGWNGNTVWSAAEILRHATDGGEIRTLSRPAEAAVATVTSFAYAGEFKKTEYAELVTSVSRESKDDFLILMQNALGSEAAAQVIDLITNELDGQADSPAAIIRDQIKRNARKRPFRKFRDFLWNLKFKVGRLLSPPGILIAVIGTDGSGKSTLVEELERQLKPVFGASRTAHLRPRLLPDLSSITSARSDGESSPTHTHTRSPGIVGSLVRWTYYWLDYLVGYQLVFRPELSRKSAIIIDRYFYDFEFDYGQKNVKLPGWMVRSMQWLLPSPDVVLFVDTDTNSVVERRGNEVDSAEIDRQRVELRAIISRLKNGKTVNGSLEANEVSSKAMKLIVQTLLQRRS